MTFISVILQKLNVFLRSLHVATPLTPEETKVQEAQVAKEGVLKRDAIAVDIAANETLLHGQMDETISSHAARAAEAGKLWGILLCWFLNLFESNHGAKAQAGDTARAQSIIDVEKQSGGIS